MEDEDKTKELLIRILNQELQAAAQMSYLAGIIEQPSLREHFLNFALQELPHFSIVAGILAEINTELSIQPVTIKLETDEIKALIILESVEDTLIHYYEDLLSPDNKIAEPMRSRLKGCLEQEKAHKNQLAQLLKEAKEYLLKKRIQNS